MKVLMLGWELPPHHTGGLGVVSEQLSRYLADSGAEIDFVLPYKADFSDTKHMNVHFSSNRTFWDFKDQDVSYGHHEIQAHSISPIHDEYRDFVERLAWQEEYDVIHAHDWLTLQAALACKTRCGAPVIAHVHATEYDRSGGSCNSLIEDIERQGLKSVDQIIAVSQKTKDTIVKQYKIPASKVSVVHNSYELQDTRDIKRTIDLSYVEKLKDSGYTIILSLGRITVQKGLPFLLKSFKIALTRNPKMLLVIGGEGEQKNDLIRMVAEQGLMRNVLFTDEFISGRRWRTAFDLSDVFIMPSVSEPFGLTPIEAINHDTATIISYQSGISEVLKNTFKVDYWDVNRMASQILALSQHQSLRDEMLSAAKKEIAKHSWHDQAQKVWDVYEGAAKHKEAYV